jgi:hypothetical protein
MKDKIKWYINQIPMDSTIEKNPVVTSVNSVEFYSRPEYEAKDIFDDFYHCLFESNIENINYNSKICALISVNKIIDNILSDWNANAPNIKETIEYFKEVRNIINSYPYEDER